MFWYCGQLYDGTTLSLSISDPGLLFGATVFTTLRVYERSLDHPLTAWQAHCNRLHSSLQTFGWRSPDWSRVRQGAESLAQLPAQAYPVLRITLFPNGTELITGRSLPDTLDQQQHEGITAWVARDAQFSRTLAGHKTGNYLSSWLALQAAQQRGVQEAILIDSTTGNWLETSTGNLWGWANGRWWTPPLMMEKSENAVGSLCILPGIVRSHLISWLKWQNERIEEEPWTPQLIAQFEALAYSNSVRQVIPIHTVLDSSPTIPKAPYPSDRHQYTIHHPALEQLRGLFQPVNRRANQWIEMRTEINQAAAARKSNLG